jgi:hypothetical protein
MITDRFSEVSKLIEKGFFVLPITANTKDKPLIKWREGSTNSLIQARKWLDRWPDANIGIDTSKHASGKFPVFIDVDNKDGRCGSEALLKLEMQGKDLPPTYTQKTANRGEHIGYLADIPLKQGTSVLGDGLDIRASGGYVVAPPSTIDGKSYTRNDLSLQPCPQWIVDACGRAGTEKTVRVNEDQASQRAISRLQMLPVAEQGNRNHRAYLAANICKDQGVSETLCYYLMEEHFVCEPMLDSAELKQVIQSAYKTGANAPGSLAPELQFSPVPVAGPEVEKSYLDEINDRYAIVYMDSVHAILHETRDEKGRRKRSFLTELTFKRKFSPKTLQASGRGKPLTQAEVWLDWENRREYAGLCFAPEREPRFGYYNLWSGFTVEQVTPEKANDRQKRGLAMFLEHAKENVCGGDEKLYAWLMTYFAHMIQKPYERPLTTLVFKGSKGTGKNALVDRIGFLLGHAHYIVAHNSRYLTSNFNGHMDSCLLLILDEAFWSGDKGADSQLKGLTTSKEILIERKGKEPYTVDNLARVVVIGNEDWLVPASADERRYAVFEMGEKRKQDSAFFAEMRMILDEAGGAGLLLNYLKTWDLAQADVNTAPKTKALLEQKSKSATPLVQWLEECLQAGQILRFDDMGVSEEWPEKISKRQFKRVFDTYLADRNIRQAFKDNDFGKRLKGIFPALNNLAKISLDDGTRLNAYEFPPLAVARKQFERFMNQEIEWNT